MDYYKVRDISRHNGEPKAPLKMLEQDVTGIAIRATVGDFYTDPRFYEYWEKYGAIGLRRTAYMVIRPNCKPADMVERFLNVVGDRLPEFNVGGWVCDDEMADRQTNGVITNAIWHCSNALSDHAGRPVFEYTRMSWWNHFVNAAPTWKQFPLWAARHSDTMKEPWSSNDPAYLKPRDWDDWALWQYSETGDGHAHGLESPHIDLNHAKNEIFAEEIPPIPDPPTLPTNYTAMTVKVDKLNTRAGPGKNYVVVGSLSRGDTVNVYDVAGTSAWIKMENGTWAAAQYGSRKYMEPKS